MLVLSFLVSVAHKYMTDSANEGHLLNPGVADILWSYIQFSGHQ